MLFRVPGLRRRSNAGLVERSGKPGNRQAPQRRMLSQVTTMPRSARVLRRSSLCWIPLIDSGDDHYIQRAPTRSKNPTGPVWRMSLEIAYLEQDHLVEAI